MSQDSSTKKYPQTTAEVAKMLGLHPAGQDLPMASFPVANSPVPGLPVVPDTAPEQKPAEAPPVQAAGALQSQTVHNELESVEQKAAEQPAYVKVGKAILPYAAIFLVGIFLYYFFFTKVDFSSMFKSQPVASTPQQTVLQQLEQQDTTSYNQWMASYYYDVTDSTILEPESDNSGNGLTNFQKYLLNLNPKSYDTLGLGQADSLTIAKGINPLTGGALTDAQNTVISKYIDMETVMNRLTLENMQNQPQVAGASTTNNTGNIDTRGSSGNGSGNQNTSVNASATLNPAGTSQVNINTSVSGLLEIPDLKIKVPVIWTSSPNNFDQDLESGVVHYPGTAMPGEVGTSYIAGHSSNYPWAKGSYNQIFSTLGKLANNTSFKITVTQTNGKTVTFDYVVTNSQQYSPTDQAQFANTGKSIVALSTCWPVGSTAKRLVVFGQLTQVEN